MTLLDRLAGARTIIAISHRPRLALTSPTSSPSWMRAGSSRSGRRPSCNAPAGLPCRRGSSPAATMPAESRPTGSSPPRCSACCRPIDGGLRRRPPRVPRHRVQRRPRGDVGVPRQQGRRGRQRRRARPRGHRRPGPRHRPGGIPLLRAVRDARRDAPDPRRRAGLVLRRDRAARAGAPDDPPKRRSPGPDRRRRRDARGLLRPRARAADRRGPGDRVRLRAARRLRRHARARPPRVPRAGRRGPAVCSRGGCRARSRSGPSGRAASSALRSSTRCTAWRTSSPSTGPTVTAPRSWRLARTSIERGSGRPCSGD